jgi:hypothetical protein
VLAFLHGEGYELGSLRSDGEPQLGANYIQAGLWKGFAIRDGNLVTGQQNFSGGETAQVIATALGR